MIFEYKVRARHRLGWKEFSFYATTDIEEFLNRNSIEYVRTATDTVEHRLLKEIEKLNKELEIRDILIKGIDKRIDNHFRKIDRCVFEDTNKLIEIQELIKKAMGSDK